MESHAPARVREMELGYLFLWFWEKLANGASFLLCILFLILHLEMPAKVAEDRGRRQF
jgi:hypothetical protein